MIIRTFVETEITVKSAIVADKTFVIQEKQS